jgi:hypothetical protein
MTRILIGLVLASSLVAAPLVPAIAQAGPPGSYQQSCRNIFVRGNTLAATCTAANGQLIRSRLNLASCQNGDIANNNGNLQCNGGGGYNGQLPGGSYQMSCGNEHMRGPLLTATCPSTNGTRITSTVNVNRCRRDTDIANINGRLECLYPQ